MRRIFSQQDHPLRQLIGRLDEAARWMNPLLAAIVIALMILDFGCAVSLIDWHGVPQPPASAAGPSAAAGQGAAAPGPATTAAAPAIATPPG